MTDLAYRLEILAEEIDDDPSALWSRSMIDHVQQAPALYRIVVGVDPPGGATEAGIIVAGVAYVGGEDHVFVLADYSAKLAAAEWAAKAVSAYHEFESDAIVAEVNYGGDMVANTVATIAPYVPVEIVRATRGKMQRAEPVAALYKNYRGLHRVHHVGELPGLEQEMCSWVPGESKWSPNRVDALVWSCFSLTIDAAPALTEGDNPMEGYRG
jgi:phage terminase large subunit-like protein